VTVTVSAPRSALRPRVLRHTLRRSIRATVGWSLALGGLVVLYAATWPAFRNSREYARLFDELPAAYRSMFTSTGAGMTTAAGFFHAELFALTGPLLVLLAAMGAGVRAVAGEEERGRLDLLLATPVSRARWVIEHAVALAAGVLAICATDAVVMLAAGAAVSADLTPGNVIAAWVHVGVAGIWFGILAVAVGAATGRPALARITVGIVALAMYLVNGLAPMSPVLERLQPLSVFRYAIGDDPLVTGLHAGHLALVLVTALPVLAAGAWLFRRRDLRH
jgi:ABC-2 type transport system permease protein